MIDAGVEVYFVKVPQTNTWIDELVISVLSILDQVHAEKSRQDARRGQRENILRGWRAGGPAPYGYQLVHEKQGTNRRGDPIVKSRLEPKPEEAEIVKEVFERFGAGESMRLIAEDLSRHRVPRKRGGCRWTNSSITEMLNKVDTYLGTAVWGAVHHARYRRGKQPRVRSRNKWTIVENAHSAIIAKASCYLIGPIERCILQVVLSVFVVAMVESERPFSDKEPVVAYEAAVVGF